MNEKENLFMEERQNKILEMLKDEEKVTVVQLGELLNVSNATIRKDLQDLENKHLLRRTHGGAIRVSRSSFELEPNKRDENIECKQSIAQEALKLIEDGDTIAIDTGSTCMELAKLLGCKNNLRVVTNDLKIAILLDQYDSITIYFIGGVIRKHYNCTVGNFGLEPFKNLVVDKAFIGTNSLSLARGATTPDLNQAEVKKMMISVSDKVILLCGSQKIGQNSFVTFAELPELDTLITDRGIGQTVREKLVDLGLEVIIVGGMVV